MLNGAVQWFAVHRVAWNLGPGMGQFTEKP